MNHKTLSMNFVQSEKKDKKMKKKLIYILAFILCGTFVLSSCNDMLNVESNRVEYEFDDWELSDSVYSALGILKAVQEIGDRQVLINELRADLLTVNETKAVIDVQQLARSEFNLDNEYLDVKDYYAIINNCNIYLARVDTTLEKNNIKLMIPEYVAVKTVRAWTYLQLAINYGAVPYFTEPILTHGTAEDVMNQPKLSRDEIVNKLIAELLPYENPDVYRMPSWEPDGKVIKFAYGEGNDQKEVDVETKQLFVPVRMLLGELYLWKGDYKNAANFLYAHIVEGVNDLPYTDGSNNARYGAKNGDGFVNDYIKMFAASNFEENSKKYMTIIPYANNELKGSVSHLDEIFSPKGQKGAAQVVASAGIQSLARRQVYCYLPDDASAKTEPEYSHTYKYPGDLRIKATTYSQRGDDDAKTEYKNIVAKFNIKEASLSQMDQENQASDIKTPYIVLLRKEHAYLRLAEAMVGLEREGYEGAANLAMDILKVGVKKNYLLMKGAKDTTLVKLDANGDTIYRYIRDDNKVIVDSVPQTYTQLLSCTDSVRYNFAHTDFDANDGIHSRGSGNSERNEYYALNDLCIARYLGMVQNVNKKDTIIGEITRADYVNYIADLVIDELALELAWEGTRFGDLIRFAEAAKRDGDSHYYDILAKRVAGRAYMNDVTYRNDEYQMDADIYSRMSNEANWYLPLPGDIVEPVDPENIPTGELPKE